MNTVRAVKNEVVRIRFSVAIHDKTSGMVFGPIQISFIVIYEPSH